MPQASWAALWVSDQGGANPCIRQALPPTPATTCNSLVTAASSSTSGENIYCEGTFNEQITLGSSAGHDNTTWDNWSGNSCTVDPPNPPTAFYGFVLGDAGNPALNVTIRDLTITTAIFDGIMIGSNSHNATILNNTISSSGNGINISSGTDIVISQNNIFSHQVAGINGSRATPDSFSGLSITRNAIHNITNGGGAGDGIALGGTVSFSVSNVTIANNFIYSNDLNGVTFTAYDDSNSVVNNSFADNDVGVNLGDSKGSPATNTVIRDNIFSIPSRAAYGIYVYNAASTSGLASNYNDFYLEGGGSNAGYWVSGAQQTLANWQTASSGDANSTDVNPQFVSAPSNLHIQAGSPVNDLGTTIVGINDDYDGDPRPWGGAWSMGADQLDGGGGGGVPEFTILTMMLALGAGIGLILLIGRLNKKHNTI